MNETLIQLLNDNNFEKAQEFLYSNFDNLENTAITDLIISVIKMDASRNNNYKYTKQLIGDLSDKGIKQKALDFYGFYLENIRTKQFETARLWINTLKQFVKYGFLDISEEELKISTILQNRKNYSLIISYLKNKKIEDAKVVIADYLYSLNKINLEKLVIDVLDFDISRHNGFNYTKNLLVDLSKENIKQQVAEYYRQYSTNVNTASFHIAKSWINIIQEAKKIGYLDLPIEENALAKLQSIELLTAGKTEEGFYELHKYLEANNMIELERLIIAIINMDIERNNNLKYTKGLLCNLTKENIIFQAQEYYRLYQENLRTKTFKMAELWLIPIYILIDLGYLELSKEKVIGEFNQYLLKDPNTSDTKEPVNYHKLINYYNQTDKDLEYICQKFHLNEEESMIFKILLAQEFYKNEFYDAGDKLIDLVQKSANKTTSVIILISQIQKNKLWLKNSEEKIKLLRVFI